MLDLQVLACNILDEHRFVLLEITEHYDTFLAKKEEATQVCSTLILLFYVNLQVYCTFLLFCVKSRVCSTYFIVTLIYSTYLE